MVWIHILFVAAFAQAEPVRLRLSPPQNIVQLSGFALRIEDASGIAHSLSPLPKKHTVEVRVRDRRWTLSFAGEKRVFGGDELRLSGEMLRLGNDEIPDTVTLYADGNRIEPVTQLELEEYLKGVIPSEMPARWPLEALKAQAVASRSYALHTMRERAGERYHLDASTNHQVFKLINYRSARGIARDNIVRAVEETRGMVLVSGSGEIYKAYYHADCGGATDEPRAVWGVGSEMGTVRDEGCALSSQWSARLSLAELEDGARTYWRLGREMKLVDIRLTETAQSGRHHRVEFVLAPGEGDPGQRVLAMPSQEFRRVFGFNLIKSTRFEVARSADQFVFLGRGHGHGVGMCQYGARFMALAGATSGAILKRYYPKARVRTLPAENQYIGSVDQKNNFRLGSVSK